MIYGYLILNILVFTLSFFVTKNKLFSLDDLYSDYIEKYSRLKGVSLSYFKTNKVISDIWFILLTINLNIVSLNFIPIYLLSGENLENYWLYGLGFIPMLLMTISALGSYVIYLYNFYLFYNYKKYDTKYTGTVAKYIIKFDLKKNYSSKASYYISELFVGGINKKYKDLNFTGECSTIACECLIPTIDFFNIKHKFKSYDVELIFEAPDFQHTLDSTIKILNDKKTMDYMITNQTEASKQLDDAYTLKLDEIYQEILSPIFGKQ